MEQAVDPRLKFYKSSIRLEIDNLSWHNFAGAILTLPYLFPWVSHGLLPAEFYPFSLVTNFQNDRTEFIANCDNSIGPAQRSFPIQLPVTDDPSLPSIQLDDCT